MKDIVFIKTNNLWNEHPHPLITITTSNYKRRDVLLRCMKAVENQIFCDIGFIDVENGSTVSFYDTNEQAIILVMFIKRFRGT